jgi:hypothetical protein
MKRTIQCLVILLLLSAAGCRGVATVLPGSDVFFQDDFSDPASGWDRVSGSDGVTDYAGGTYRLFSALSDYYLWATPGRLFERDVRIEADAIKVSGPDDGVFGLICRYQDAENFYVFMISADGQAGIAKVLSGRDLVMLSGATLMPSSRIQTGLATNHLQADCLGSTLAFFVNGEQVASADDSSFTGGDVGLWLGDYEMPGMEVYMDNFVVRRP